MLNSTPGSFHFFSLFMDLNGVFLNVSFQDTVHYYSTPNKLRFDNLGNSYCSYFAANVIDSGGNEVWTHNLRKFDSFGNELWVRKYEDIDFYKFDVDDFGNVFSAGELGEDTVDFDPGIGVHYFINDTIIEFDHYVYILKLDSNGDFVKVYIQNEEIINNQGQFFGYHDIQVGNVGEIYTINTGHFIGEIFKYFEDSCSFTSVISNVQDVGCVQSGAISTSVTGGNPPFTFNWLLPLNAIDTSTNTVATQGIQTVEITDSIGCSSSHSVLVNGPVVNAGFDAMIQTVTNGFAPGFNSTIWVFTKNNGCQSVNGVYSLVLDSTLQYISASPAPDLVSGDTLFWNYSATNYDSSSFETTISVFTPTWASIGQIVNLETSILPLAGDVNTTNNFEQISMVVVASLDPNDIAVYPAGLCSEGYVSPTQKLTYKIRFQNTGTAPAVNVFVLDSISLLLNLNTIRILESSHLMHLEILPGGILKFVFNNIYLADSSSNEAESHGYVLFEIEPLAELSQGMEIYNRVGIYFDFNAPVYTNQVRNTIYEGDLNALVCSSLSLSDLKAPSDFVIYPNPTKHLLTIQSSSLTDNHGYLSVLDKNGRTLMTHEIVSDKQTIDVINLDSGFYFLVLDIAGKKEFTRFVKY